MKNLLLLTLLITSLPLVAFEAVTSSKANFGASAQTATQEGTNSGAPNSQTRTFSTYQSRQQNWSKGVQTQTVQTNVAGQGGAQEPKVNLPTVPAPAGKSASKGTSAAGKAAPAVKNPKETSAPKATSSLRGNNQQEEQAAPAPAENPMDTVQKMMGGNADVMKALSGSGALPTGGGMPDLSKLLGGGGAAAPSTLPKK